VKAYSAATDNVGLFFGEDIFFAIGSIVLIQQILSTYGYNLAPLELALWAIPTAIAAFVIHGGRLILFDRKLARHPRESGGPAAYSVVGQKKRDSRFRGNDEGGVA
jgi:uncharacterized membrane protein